MQLLRWTKSSHGDHRHKLCSTMFGLTSMHWEDNEQRQSWLPRKTTQPQQCDTGRDLQRLTACIHLCYPCSLNVVYECFSIHVEIFVFIHTRNVQLIQDWINVTALYFIITYFHSPWECDSVGFMLVCVLSTCWILYPQHIGCWSEGGWYGDLSLSMR